MNHPLSPVTIDTASRTVEREATVARAIAETDGLPTVAVRQSTADRP
jgi:hypothetical protein